MWLRHLSPNERRTVLAAFLGYGVDGFDLMIYTFIIPTLLVLWHLTRAEAGTIATAALLTSAIGGWAAGLLADRYGRVRILQVTILWFTSFTLLSGFTHSFGELLTTRALQGLGFGGEWSVGSVLVAETVAARHRGKAAGLVQSSWAVGWAAAAFAFWGASAVAPPETAWRILFWSGSAPALLILYIRRHVRESPLFLAARTGGGAAGPGAPAAAATALDFLAIFRAPLRGTTALASLLSCGMLGGYYSITTWLPTYLTVERHVSVTGTSGYLLVLIGGSFTGYLAGAWLSDALGRRRGFMVFAVGSMTLVLAYLRLPIPDAAFLALGFPLGFFLSGIFSGMGAFLAELYPTAHRGSGQGFCYNVGRAASAACPALIGAWSAHGSLATAVGGFAVGSYALVILCAWALPETRGRSLTPLRSSAPSSR